MIVSAIQPTIDVDAFLTGAQFADAFSVSTGTTNLTAREAAERMFNRSPPWVRFLLRLRDIVVTPFGLKTSKTARGAIIDKVGFFPVLNETPQRLVAGLNDTHLDFRVVIDVTADGAGQRMTATTIVLTHNRLGHTYLILIKPIHRMVVRSMLKQVNQS